jgi:hypothetical protein
MLYVEGVVGDEMEVLGDDDDDDPKEAHGDAA